MSIEDALEALARGLRPVLILYAHWADSGSPVYAYDPEDPDGDGHTGRQVADFRHDTAAAARHLARECAVPGLYAVLYLTPNWAATATSTVELYELDLDGRRVQARGTYRLADLADVTDPDADADTEEEEG